MSPNTASPPYFDRLLKQLTAANPDAQAAFGRHVHWGYWNDPSQASLGVEEYGAAAEALCDELLKMAELHDSSKVLDVGCGFGGTLATLNEQHSQMQMIGVNIDLQQLQRAATQLQPRAGNAAEFVLADAAQLPLAGESFDVALAVECVFHFDRPRFFAEIARVLQRGGTLTLSDFVPHERAASYLEAMDIGSNEAIRTAYGAIDLSWSLERYRALAAEHELVLTDAREVTDNTLPTYDFLRHSVAVWSDTAEAEPFLRATEMLEKASRRGIMGYQIVRFEKQ